MKQLRVIVTAFLFCGSASLFPSCAEQRRLVLGGLARLCDLALPLPLTELLAPGQGRLASIATSVGLFKFLAAGRADTVIMTADVYDFGKRMNKHKGALKRAGCLPNEELAVGLSKNNLPRARWIADRLDSGIAKLRQSGEIKTTMDKYGIRTDPAPKSLRRGTRLTANRVKRTARTGSAIRHRELAPHGEVPKCSITKPRPAGRCWPAPPCATVTCWRTGRQQG